MALGLQYLHRISGKIDILFKKWFRNLLFWTWLRSSPVGQANFATWIGLNGLNQPRCHKFMFGPDCEMQLSLSSKVSYDILQIQEKSSWFGLTWQLQCQVIPMGIDASRLCEDFSYLDSSVRERVFKSKRACNLHGPAAWDSLFTWISSAVLGQLHSLILWQRNILSKMPEADEEYFQDRSSLAGLAHALCMAGGHRDLANADV